MSLAARPEPRGIEHAHATGDALRSALEGVLRGKPETVRGALVALLSGGHLLIDDVPGVGKTLLAKALARATGGTFHRVQGTPDLLPSEITGVSVYQIPTSTWEFRRGPLFANVVLVDELNRTTPRTQSALLEAMEERQVTVDGATHSLPSPFFLVATQNPHETVGTFPLVEGQLDRFALVISIGTPDAVTERSLLLGSGGGPALEELRPITDPVALADVMHTVAGVFASEAIADYAIAITRATRDRPNIAIGASPRASLALLQASRASALLDGRDYVVPNDIQQLALSTLAHRLVLRDSTELDDARAVLATIVESIAVPKP